jgi:hypothetical protein
MSALFRSPRSDGSADPTLARPSGQQGQPLLGVDPNATESWRSTQYRPGTGLYGLPDSTKSSTFNDSDSASTDTGTRLAQLLPPVLFARPPLIYPRPLTPLEDLPQGSAGGPGAGRPFPQRFNEQQPDNVPCTYCGRPTTTEQRPDKLNGEHVIPRSQGGNNNPTNYTPACRTCNLKKGGRTPAQWYELMRPQA